MLDLIASTASRGPGDPDASPPPWLGHRWPDDAAGGRGRARLWYGSRNRFCPSSDPYRERSQSITTALARPVRRPAALAMWHWATSTARSATATCPPGRSAPGCATATATCARSTIGGGTTFWSQGYRRLPGRVVATAPRAVHHQPHPAPRLVALLCSERLLAHSADARPAARPHAERHVTTNSWASSSGWTTGRVASNGEHVTISNDCYPSPATRSAPSGRRSPRPHCGGLAGGGRGC
ncbi:beta-galactosidase [Nonomuraea rubra]|uniref:beta-galactosidase n=1 Tax=Nonomuraea rubra TaxID=46180 RepID=UPI003CD0AD70